MQHRAWYHRFVFDPTAWMRQVRFSPALASVLLLVGFGSGLGTMYSALGHGKTGTNSTTPVESSIGGITSIEHKPNSNDVKIQYQRVVPDSVEGSISDPKIQELLTFTARSNFANAGARIDAVNLLTGKPTILRFAKHSDPRVREALAYALRYDSNPGVRLKALDRVEEFCERRISVFATPCSMHC